MPEATTENPVERRQTESTVLDEQPVLVARNVFSNWSVAGVRIIYALFVTPYVVKVLQKDLYGVWTFLNSLTAYSQILYFGLGSAIVRQIARYRAEQNPDKINRVASVVLTLYSAIGAACCVAFLCASPFLPKLFSSSLDEAACRSASLVTALLGVQVLLLFVTSAFTGIMTGFDRFDLVNLVQICGTVLRAGALFLFFDGPGPLVRLAVIMTALMAAEMVSVLAILHLRFGWIKLRIVRPRVPELRLLYSFGLQSFLIILALRIMDFSDTMVAGIMLGAASVTFYALPQMIISYSSLVTAGFSSVFLPRVTMMYARRDYEGLRTNLRRSLKVATLCSTFVMTNAAFLGAPFLSLWVGPEFAEHARWIVVILGVTGILRTVSIQMPLAFLQAMSLLRIPARIRIAEALLNLLLSFVLAYYLGLIGIALGTLIPALLFSFLVLPTTLCRELSLGARALFVESLTPSTILFFSIFLFLYAFDHFMHVETWSLFFICGALTVPVFLAVGSLTLSSEDRLWVKSLISHRASGTT